MRSKSESTAALSALAAAPVASPHDAHHLLHLHHHHIHHHLHHHKQQQRRSEHLTNHHHQTTSTPTLWPPAESSAYISELIRPSSVPRHYSPALRRQPSLSLSPQKRRKKERKEKSDASLSLSLSLSRGSSSTVVDAADIQAEAALQELQSASHLLSAISTADTDDALVLDNDNGNNNNNNENNNNNNKNDDGKSPPRTATGLNPQLSSSLTTASHTTENNDKKKKKKLFAQTLSSYPPEHFSNRLYTISRWRPPPEKASDSIVSDLPNEALRWIKKRRTMDSHQRVVISYIRDKQLKEMFSRLDFGGHGAIELGELTDAIRYVKQKLALHSGGQASHHFQNLDRVFAEMDDNGDGTVDYQEFTKGMTGTAQSAFDKASQYDVDKLFSLFIEYGEMRQRQLAVATITKPVLTRRPPSRASANREKEREALELDNGDLTMYQNFKVLFGEHHGKKSKNLLADEHGTPINELGKQRADEEEQLLNRFIASNQLHQYGCVVADESQTINTNSVSTLATGGLQAEKLYHTIHEKQRLVRRDRLDDLATDFGILEIQSKMANDRKVDIPTHRHSHHTLPTIAEPHAAAKPTKRRSSASSPQRPPPLIPTGRARNDLSIRMQARKEAFDLMRNKQGDAKGINDDLQEPSTSSWSLRLFGNRPAGADKESVASQESSKRTDLSIRPALISRGSFIYS